MNLSCISDSQFGAENWEQTGLALGKNRGQIRDKTGQL